LAAGTGGRGTADRNLLTWNRQKGGRNVEKISEVRS
jgi:hypothetical protein